MVIRRTASGALFAKSLLPGLLLFAGGRGVRLGSGGCCGLQCYLQVAARKVGYGWLLRIAVLFAGCCMQGWVRMAVADCHVFCGLIMRKAAQECWCIAG